MLRRYNGYGEFSDNYPLHVCTESDRPHGHHLFRDAASSFLARQLTAVGETSLWRPGKCFPGRVPRNARPGCGSPPCVPAQSRLLPPVGPIVSHAHRSNAVQRSSAVREPSGMSLSHPVPTIHSRAEIVTASERISLMFCALPPARYVPCSLLPIRFLTGAIRRPACAVLTGFTPDSSSDNSRALLYIGVNTLSRPALLMSDFSRYRVPKRRCRSLSSSGACCLHGTVLKNSSSGLPGRC